MGKGLDASRAWLLSDGGLWELGTMQPEPNILGILNRLISMTTTTPYPNAPELSPDDYVIIGLATCFIKEDGEVHQVQVVEPIPSGALEAILKGVPTSYSTAWAVTLGSILNNGEAKIPPELTTDAHFCENFIDRAIAATRTYKNRPQATIHIPLGTTFKDFNFSLERKRVLNSERIIRTEDNVKQHAYTHQVL